MGENLSDEAGGIRFDWNDADVIVPCQPRTAMYWNPRDQLILRQEAQGFEDDPYLIFAPEKLPALIGSLQAAYATWIHDQQRVAGGLA